MRAGRIGVVLAVAALLALAPEARAAKVVVFGDSWGYGGWQELGAHLAARGHPEMTVESYAVPGSSADFWANVQPNAMRDAVSLNPDAEYVWLSITGNDVFAHYAAGNGASCAADNDANLRKMLDDFFAVHPGVKVASFGYDFVNYEQSPECILTGITIFPGFATPQVNLTLLNDVGAVMQAVDADYPNFTFVPVWGTLQAAGGIPGAPNILFPSPSQYFADCIHPNTAGFNLIMSRFYDLYWDAELGPGDPPPPSCVTARTGEMGPASALLAATMFAAPFAAAAFIRRRRAGRRPKRERRESFRGKS